MTTQAMPQSTRWTQITAIWKDNRWLYALAGILLGILFTPAIEQITGNLSELIGNLVPEAIGIIFTVLILDRLAANRSKEELKTRLLNEVKNPAAGIAVNALDWLRRENWIDDETFKGKSMRIVNWEGAYIGDLNLEGARLYRANFKNALNFLRPMFTSVIKPVNMSKVYMREADLSNADLDEVNLAKAILRQANLSNAKLDEANLAEAILRQANLSATRLRYVNLSEADLRGTTFDEKTVLPDADEVKDKNGVVMRDEEGNRIYTNYWTPDTDMTRYTNPNHPDFWQPTYLKRDHDGDRPWWVTDDMLTD